MLPFATFALFSFRNELKIVVGVFIFILLLPLIGVVVLTNFGFQAVSDKLATINATTNTVEIHNLDGTITAFTAAMAWPMGGVVTLEFGQPDPPYQLLHTGIDIADPDGQQGDPIHPFAKGTVTFAGADNSGYGNYVVIDNGDHVSSLYGHMEKVATKVGSTVDANDIIGYEGETGNATGPHVHFQIEVFGIPVNPRTFVSGNP